MSLCFLTLLLRVLSIAESIFSAVQLKNMNTTKTTLKTSEYRRRETNITDKSIPAEEV